MISPLPLLFSFIPFNKFKIRKQPFIDCPSVHLPPSNHFSSAIGFNPLRVDGRCCKPLSTTGTTALTHYSQFYFIPHLIKMVRASLNWIHTTMEKRYL